MSRPTGADIAQALKDALDAILNPPPPQPVCECGSVTAFYHQMPRGVECHRGHRLPGQDMPRAAVGEQT